MKRLLKILLKILSRLLSRRSISIFLMVVLSGGFVVYQMYTDDERVRVMAEEYFTRKAGRCVHIESASFSLFEPIKLRNVTMASPPGSDASSLTVELVAAEHNPWSLLTGRLEVTDILCVKPVVTIIRRMAPTSRPACPTSRPEAPPASLPAGISLRVRDALVRVVWFDASGAMSLTEMPISLVATPEGSVYRILFGQRDLAGLHGEAAIACAETRLETLDASVSVQSLLSMLPPELRDSVGQYAPAGMLRVTPGATGPYGRTFMIDLDDVSGKLPESIGDVGVVGLAGRVILDPAQGVWTSGPLMATVPRLGGAQIEVKGVWMGVGDKASGRVDAVIRYVTLPEDAGGGKIGKILTFVEQEYQLRGQFDVRVSYDKQEGANGEYQTSILPQNVSGVYSGFPERVDNITGSIDITSVGVKFDLIGERGRGVVTISGSYSEKGELEVIVDARDVAIDKGIRDAIPAAYSDLWPMLNPTGRARAITRVRRQKEGGDTSVAVTIDLDGHTEISYRDFPYLLEGISGVIRIMDDDVQISVEGRHGETPIGVEGWLVGLGDDSSRMDLTIDVKNLELNEAFFVAAGDKVPAGLKELHPAGTISKAVIVATRDGKGPVGYTIDVMKGNSFKLDTLPHAITDVAGRVEIISEAVLLESLSGRYGQAEIGVEGDILLRDKGTPILDGVTVTATGMEVDDDLLAALPTKAREVLSGLSPSGPIDLTIDLRHKGSGRDELDYKLVVKPKGLAMTYSKFPYPVKGIAGEVLIKPGRVEIRKLKISCEGGVVDVEGWGDEAGAALTLQAKNLRVGKELIAAIFKVAPQTAMRLKPGGTVGLDGLELMFGSAAPAPPAAPTMRASQPTGASTPAGKPWRARGVVTFNDTYLTLGLSPKAISGRVWGEVFGPGLGVDAKLVMDSIAMGNQRITNLKATIAKHSSADVMRIDGIEARAYDGGISGWGTITFGDVSSIMAKLTVAGIDVSKLVNAGITDPKKRSDITGRLKGRMWMGMTDVKDTSTRSGGGVVCIRDGKITKLPVVMELLHLIQVELPGNTSFTDADIEYTLKGDMVTYDELFLNSDVLSLIGSGTTNISTGELRLRFLHGFPGRVPRMDRFRTLWTTRFRELLLMIGGKIAITEVTGTVSKPDKNTVFLPFTRVPKEFIRKMLDPREE